MRSLYETWAKAFALTVLVVSVVACGAELRRPLIAYDFDNPILNERWLRAHHDPLPPAARAAGPKTPAPTAVAEATPPAGGVPAGTPSALKPSVPQPEGPSKAVAVAGSPAPAAPVSPRGAPATPLPVIKAGEQAVPAVAKADPKPEPKATVAKASGGEESAVKPSVPKSTAKKGASRGNGSSAEVADAAGRLVGIRSSFDQDTFLKHVLFVSNVALDDAPVEGLVGWVWKNYGDVKSKGISPGHLVFLGWGGRARIVGVVESVDEHGTAQFVTVHGDEVKRRKINLSHPQARRDERSGRILNSAVGKGRLAGECLLGSVAVVPDASGSSALATAE